MSDRPSNLEEPADPELFFRPAPMRPGPTVKDDALYRQFLINRGRADSLLRELQFIKEQRSHARVHETDVSFLWDAVRLAFLAGSQLRVFSPSMQPYAHEYAGMYQRVLESILELVWPFQPDDCQAPPKEWFEAVCGMRFPESSASGRRTEGKDGPGFDPSYVE